MNIHTPTLKQLPDGRYFTVWGRKRHYFGRDPDLAIVRYGESLKTWRDWRNKRQTARDAITAGYTAGAEEPLVVDLVEKFVAHCQLTKKTHAMENIRCGLKRFAHVYKHERVAAITVAHLEALRQDLLRANHAKTSINKEMSTIKTALNWGYAMFAIPPLPLNAIKRLPVGEPPDKSLTHAEVRYFLMSMPPRVRAWLAVNYLTAARPVEVVRLVHGQGKWLYPGVFRLDRGKTDNSGSPRHMIVTPHAQRWLARCKPHWTSTRTYRLAVTGVEKDAPDTVRLRHSAMTHLLQSGVPRADADLILGHVPNLVSRTYGRPEWQRLVPLADQLTFQHEPSCRVSRQRGLRVVS